MLSTKTILVSGLFLFVLVNGCSEKSVKTNVDSVKKQAEPSSVADSDVPLWPEQWVVVEEDRWIPVTIDLDRDLVTARNAFVRKDHKRVISALEAGITWLKEAKGRAPEKRAGEFDKARTALEKLAAKVKAGDQIPISDFDKGLGQVYPKDMKGLWSAEQIDAVLRFMESPSPHFANARKLLNKKEYDGAADEVRRGADWLALVALNSEESEDRDALDKTVANLRQVANDIEKGRVASAKLNSVLSESDRTYAIYFLHWAERAQRDKALKELVAPLTALATRIEAGAEWMGRKLDKGEDETVSKIRIISRDIKNTGSHTEREITAVLKKVRQHFEL
jgi:hypothetical protein